MEATVPPAGSPDRSRRLLSYVGAVAVAIAACVLFAILWPLRWSLVAFWVAIEACFYVFVWRPRYAELSAQPLPHHRPASEEEAWALFARMLAYFQATKGTIDYEMYYSGWFLGARFEDIKRGNAEEFLAYAFWYRTMDEMRAEGMADVPRLMLDQLEDAWGLALRRGYTPGLQFMGHLWEPLKAHWRPLAFYLSTWAIGLFAGHMLRRWGFQQASHQGMFYFTLNMEQLASRSSTSARQPFGLPPITGSAEESERSAASAASTATSPAAAAAAADAPGSVAPAAMERPCSSPELQAAAGASNRLAVAAQPGARSISSTDLSALRTRSSPFVSQGLSWGSRLAADAENLAASINVASAVHSPEPDAVSGAGGAAATAKQQQQQHQAASAAGPIRRSGSSLKRRQGGGVSFGASAPGTPRLTSHTSMALRQLPNPLEQVLSEELANPDMPVLFLHGVGGLPAYLEMLLQVMALGHPLIVTQCTSVAMRLGPVHSADEVVEQVIGVLDKLGIEQACVIGHSYGTFIAGRLARLHRHRVRSLCLIDPVCFGMFMPQLLNNFLYTKPKWRGLHHFVDWAKETGVYLAGHELHVCATFSRRFFWTDLNLWPDDLAPGSVVLLSGRDDLMNAQQVKAMLEKAGHVKVHYNRDLTHGEFLIKSEVKQAIMEEVRTMLARSGSAVVGLARPVLATTMTLACSALGVGGAVRLQTAGGGAKYVEDHANNLVRTFTGNLTAMLQQVQSVRALDSTALASSGGGGECGAGGGGGSAMRSRLSRGGPSAAGAGAPGSSNSSSSVGGSASSGSASADRAPAAAGAASGPGLLSGAMSLPLKQRKGAKASWTAATPFQDIQEQPSGGGVESSGSTEAEQLEQQQQDLTEPLEQQGTDAPLLPQAPAGQDGGGKKGSLAVRAAARRSSGSGRVEAAAGSKPATDDVPR